VIAVLAVAAFLASDNPWPAAIIAAATAIAWAGYVVRRRRG
jgi:hypothetical protein